MEKEKEKPKLPSISVSDIGPLGLMTLTFNQDFRVPREWQKIDFSHVISLELRSASDGSVVTGEFTKNLPERILKDKSSESTVKDCIGGDCEAQRNGFRWYVADHTNQGMKIQVDFENKGGISRSPEGYDILQMHFPLM